MRLNLENLSILEPEHKVTVNPWAWSLGNLSTYDP